MMSYGLIAYTFYVRLIILAFILICCGCGEGRNFEGSPEPFVRPNSANANNFIFYPEFLYDFRTNQNGFEFSIFLKSMDGFNGSSLTIKSNKTSGRVTIGNVNFGQSNCTVINEVESCDVQWLNSTPYYNFDVNRYRLAYELKSIVSVLKVETNETANFRDCVLNTSENFTSGERLKITLTDLETLQKKEIIFFNFGTQNFSSFVNPILPDVNNEIALDAFFGFVGVACPLSIVKKFPNGKF